MRIKFAIISLSIFAFGAPAALGQGITTRVNVNSSGQTSGINSAKIGISADGRFVFFYGSAWQFYPGLGSGSYIFVHDRLLGSTAVASLRPDGWLPTGSFSEIVMSPSGAVIAFSYSGGDLVPTDTNNAQDVYVRNWQTNTLERVSLAATGTQPNSDCTSPVISADGRIVAFESSASNLLPGDTNGKRDIFIKDRLTSIVTRASVSSSGMQGSGDSWEPTMSADGRWIAFRCDSNLGTSYNGPYPTIFLHDRTTLTTVPVVVSQIGQVPGPVRVHG